VRKVSFFLAGCLFQPDESLVCLRRILVLKFTTRIRWLYIPSLAKNSLKVRTGMYISTKRGPRSCENRIRKFGQRRDNEGADCITCRLSDNR
jgi:hypothetical protein